MKTAILESEEGKKMTVEIISWSISTVGMWHFTQKK